MAVRLLHESDLPACRAALAETPRLAIDTEFHAERRYVPRLYLVQIGIPGGDAWIVDPLVEGLLPQIRDELIARPWIVHGGSQDLLLLQRALGGLPDIVLDTQIGAGFLSERYPQGYSTLVMEHLKVHLPKTATLSDWSRRPLSREQVHYAADDVARLPALWEAIERGLREKGRLDWAEAACVESRLRSAFPPDPAEAWRGISAAVSMDGPARAILKGLAGWREQLAQELDQPPRGLVGDGVLIELAKRPPSHASGITANRRFPKVAHRWVEDLWGVISTLRSAPPSEHPRLPERYSAPWRHQLVLQAWIAEWSHRVQIAAPLVFGPTLQEQLALDVPHTREEVASLLGPWRDQALGDDLWKLCEGRASVNLRRGDPALPDRY